MIALTLPASGLARNIRIAALNAPVDSLNSCPTRSLLLNFDVDRGGQAVRQVPIWRLQNDAAFFFTSSLMIDADGAPNAYNPEDTGLDDLSNAGQPGHWDGIIADEEGNPVVQGPDDPSPGYYISCTALSDWTKGRIDPTRYVDASKIPYIALPGELAHESGARLGDLAVVVNTRNGRSAYAIFADIGRLGEGSIALADNLGIWSDARQGGRWGGILYLVFPGSGEHRPMSLEEINARTETLFHDWGGMEHVRSCADRAPENTPFRFE
ncbi:MAG TPA: glycoside hydrolase family 75 protein [Candidatus Acidoferrales bacterium]